MDYNDNDSIDKVRFIAITGATTREGGTVEGTSAMSFNDAKAVLEGDIVTYKDGTTALVMPDYTTRLTSPDKTVAAVGTKVSNDDEIINAGQYVTAVVYYKDKTSSLCYFDDAEEIRLLRERGVIA